MGNCRPSAMVRPVASPRAATVGRYASRCAASSTTLRVWADTGRFPESTWETVVMLTRAARATSAMRAGRGPLGLRTGASDSMRVSAGTLPVRVARVPAENPLRRETNEEMPGIEHHPAGRGRLFLGGQVADVDASHHIHHLLHRGLDELNRAAHDHRTHTQLKSFEGLVDRYRGIRIAPQDPRVGEGR